MIVLSAVAAAQAQSTKEEARRVILGSPKGSGGETQNPKEVILGRGGNDAGYPAGNSREARIEQVNREYNERIQAIRNDRYMSNEQKERAIRDLERERAQKIREINQAYGSDGDRDHKEGKYKKNNGRHLGWEKGKGNPHRSGGNEKSKKKKNKD